MKKMIIALFLAMSFVSFAHAADFNTYDEQNVELEGLWGSESSEC